MFRPQEKKPGESPVKALIEGKITADQLRRRHHSQYSQPGQQNADLEEEHPYQQTKQPVFYSSVKTSS